MTIILGPYVVGERPDPIRHTFLDAAGDPIDLTGYTASANLQAPRSTEGQAVDLVTIPTPTDGTVQVDLEAMVDTDGTWRAEVWVDQPDGRRYASERFRFYARAALPAPA